MYKIIIYLTAVFVPTFALSFSKSFGNSFGETLGNKLGDFLGNKMIETFGSDSKGGNEKSSERN